MQNRMKTVICISSVIVVCAVGVGAATFYGLKKQAYDKERSQVEKKLCEKKRKKTIAFGDLYSTIERIASVECKIEGKPKILEVVQGDVDTSSVEYSVKIDRKSVEEVLRDAATKARSATIVFKDGSPIIREDKWKTPTKCSDEIAKSLERCVEEGTDFDIKEFSERPKVVAADLQGELQKAEKWKDSWIVIDADPTWKLAGCDVDKVLSWKDGIVVDEDGMQEWVKQLAEKVDTVNKTWKFKTHAGKNIKVPVGTLGNKLNVSETTKAVVKGLKKREHEVEAVWEQRSIGTFGEDGSVGSTYVEVSVKEQRLWYVVNGKVKLKTSIVTGLPTVERHTKEGAHQILYKQEDRILRGAAKAYSTHVDYWMPFTLDGQGLHDADWRSSFGDKIYQTGGSHGCVNMPDAYARKLYRMVKVGTPVIVY